MDNKEEKENSGSENGFSMKKEFTEYLAAASIGFAILCAGASWFFYSKWQQAENKVMALEAQQSVVTQHSNALNFNLQHELQENLNVLSVLLDTNTISVELKGLPVASSSKAKVFWKKESQRVYLSLSYLPEPPKDKQYQLWAIQDGKPVDAGVFNLDYPIHKMNDIEDAQTFIVTLEKKGGGAVPDLEAMYLKGEI